MSVGSRPQQTAQGFFLVFVVLGQGLCSWTGLAVTVGHGFTSSPT